MALPRFDLPVYHIVLPVSKTKVAFRAYTAREEKLLLIAKEAGGEGEIELAVKQIVKNCADIDDADDLCQADRDYLLLQLRSKVNGNIESLTYICKSVDAVGEEKVCGGNLDVDIDLDSITTTSTLSNVIKLGSIGMTVKVPSINEMKKAGTANVKFLAEKKIALIYISLVNIFENDDVTEKRDITFKEFEEWYLSMPSNYYKLVNEFFDNLPDISFTTDVKCPKCGVSHSITLRGIEDFFPS